MSNNIDNNNALAVAGGIVSTLAGASAIGAAQPDWLLQIGNMTTGSLKGFEKFAPIYTYKLDMSRGINAESTSNLSMSGGIEAEPFIVACPSSALSADIRASFSKGLPIPDVVLIRLMKVNGQLEVQRKYTFSSCYLINIKTTDDVTGLSISYKVFTESVTSFGPDGKKTGNSANSHDLTSAQG
jgi:hypothetical protein